MQEDKVFYFLQPGSEQAIGLARILKESPDCKVIAVFLEGEKKRRSVTRYYSRVMTVSDYSVISEKYIVPFGAASTSYMLNKTDVNLVDAVMRRSALSAYDKNKFLKFCEVNGLPIPKTFASLAEVKPQDYPLFFKQRYEKGGGARGVAVKEFDIPSRYREDLVYQELIDTPGTYGVGFIAREGKVEVCLSHFESSSFPISGGSAVDLEIYHNPRLIDLTATYVRLSKYSGWGLAEFKWCNKRQDFVFMEVNAKLWASCEFSFRNEPGFANRMFGVSFDRERIDKIVFVNRAFLAGFYVGLRSVFGKRGIKKLVYPGLFRAIVIGLIPQSSKNNIKRFLGR